MSANRNLWIVTGINNRSGEQVFLSATASRERARREARRINGETYSSVRIGRVRKLGAGITVS